MSVYHESGSGPHSEREKGARGCGCTHDGHRWLTLCPVAKAASDEEHARAQADHEAQQRARAGA